MSDPSLSTDPVVVKPSVVEVTSKIGDPGPLGLAGFAMTTFILSLSNANWIPAAAGSVLALALAYGGLVQLLAGMWEFKNGNTFGAVAFSSYGAFWLAFFYYVKYIAATLPAATAHTTTGWFLLAWGIFTLYMLVASLKTNGAVIAVFFFLTVTFFLLAIGALGNHAEVTKIGGVIGIVTAICAWYASFAGVTNATWKKTVLPVWPIR